MAIAACSTPSPLQWKGAAHTSQPAKTACTTSAILSCPAGAPRGATRVDIPADGTENDDKNPPRIQPRNLFDAAIGEDNLFNGDRYKWSLRLTGVNITNKYALYNFLSTFSGTHYVTPRAITGQISFSF